MEKIDKILIALMILLMIVMVWILIDHINTPDDTASEYSLARIIADTTKGSQVEAVQVMAVVEEAIPEPEPEIIEVMVISEEGYSHDAPPFVSRGSVSRKRSYTDEDIDLLARLVYAEARGESDEGQIAVVNVVLNRVKSDVPYFANSIKEVIFQKATSKGRTVWQFSPAKYGLTKEADERAYANTMLALEGARAYDMPDDVYYFYKPTSGNKGTWITNRKLWKKIGSHLFCY